MIASLLAACAKCDGWLHARLGRPYGVVLTVGLMIEIGHRLAEAPRKAGEAHRLLGLGLLILLDAALLLHQLGELGERLSEQDARARGAEDAGGSR
jgi:hypothetical protein